MDRDAIRAWRRGHEMAQERILAETRGTTPAERVAQLVTLSDAAVALGWKTTDPAEVDVVRARFVKLHARLGARR